VVEEEGRRAGRVLLQALCPQRAHRDQTSMLVLSTPGGPGRAL
jgi:hypothetical protein